MSRAFEKRPGGEVARINRVQSDFFGGLIHIFDPPLPEGVPERLEQIVAAGDIKASDVVLDVGSGTGILIPLIERRGPERIYACDLSEAMLSHLFKKYPFVTTIVGDVGDLTVTSRSIDVAFINAAYPNIVDKDRAFRNLSRMLKPRSRLIISHPMGRAFIDRLKDRSPFPLDDFPRHDEAEIMLAPYGLTVSEVIDDPELYVLTAHKKERISSQRGFSSR